MSWTATLPTGRGLFAFNTLDEAVAAFAEIDADYDLHAKAALEIAQDARDARDETLNLLGRDDLVHRIVDG